MSKTDDPTRWDTAQVAVIDLDALDRPGERRVAYVPWRRPRTTDLRTGERVYKERRKMSTRVDK